MNQLTKFDHFLNDDGPAALVIREYLMPVEGTNGVVFPATFAAGDNFPGGYNIDGDPNGSNVCLLDTVGSQANRIEPIFRQAKYAGLVPQIVVKAGEKLVNILDAGHRAGDAIIRCSSLKDAIDGAFLASIKGDAEPLAKIAPTSLVFGVWNSRGEKGSQEKRPRLIASTIRAFNVRRLTRSAVYNAPVDYSGFDVFSEEDKQKAEGDPKNPLSKRGFVNALASGTHGGVIASGGIRRDATLGLAALRLLHGSSRERTRVLQRYILGLALTAFTHNPSGYFRQGCLLVLDPDKLKEREFVEVYPSGERKPMNIAGDDALEFAQAAAESFGLDPKREIKSSENGPDRTVEFDKERARRDLKEGDKKAKQRAAKDRKADAQSDSAGTP
jgi:CRISPR-associated protein Csb1